jgi:hypothetical protein
VSVRNSLIFYDGTYREICGYAEVPDPEYPGELKVTSFFGGLTISRPTLPDRAE